MRDKCDISEKRPCASALAAATTSPPAERAPRALFEQLPPSLLISCVQYYYIRFIARQASVTSPSSAVETAHNATITLTALFTALIFLAATQDIAVDGWALELLTGPDAGLASTCQSLGMSLGWFLSYTAFTALNAPDFCGKFLSWTVACPEASIRPQIVAGPSARHNLSSPGKMCYDLGTCFMI